MNEIVSSWHRQTANEVGFRLHRLIRGLATFRFVLPSMILSALMGFSGAAEATTVTVSTAGEFGSSVIADSLAAPSESWAISFNVDVEPLAGNADALGFDAPFSDFSYLLNGSSVAVSPESIRFYMTDGGGLFTAFFGPETGFYNGQPIPEFTFSGNQVFSGTTSNPTILAGSYAVSDALYSDALNYDDEGGGADFAIASASSSVPEPSTLPLCLVLLLIVTCLWRIRKLGDALRRFNGWRTHVPHFLITVSGLFLLFSAPRIAGGQVTVANPSFEVPNVGACPNLQYAPAGASWSFESAGITTGGCNARFNAPALPPGGGTQAGFIQGQGSAIGQTIGGFDPVQSYQITFWAAGRPAGAGCDDNCTEINFSVFAGATDVLDVVNPPTGTFQKYISKPFTAAGVITIMFSGTVGAGQSADAASFIDLVAIQDLGSTARLLGDCNCPTTTPGQVTVGQPITISTGNMFEQAADYTTAGQNPLGFTRYYNSLGNTASVATLARSLGVNWRSTYDRYLNLATAGIVTAERADGQQLTFSQSGSAWTSDTDVDVTLTNAGGTWTLTDHDDTVETYTAINAIEAQIQSIKSRNGYTQALAYDASEQLISVSDSYGRALTFTYLASGLLHTVTTPDGTTINYGFSATGSGNVLTSATYSTVPAATITYLYGDPALPFALTGIIDENGNRYATWTYDASGHALSSQLGTGANLVTLVYNADGSRTVTNALGVTDTYKFTTLQGVPKVTQIDRAATATTAAATEVFTYDANGYTASQTDWNGNETKYVNDAHGDPTTINEAVGTSAARTTTVTYDATFVHLPKQIVTPGLTATFTYDASGELLTRTLTDTTTNAAPYSTNGQTRVSTNSWANFLLASTKTPNGNITTFAYDGSGALTTVTNALGHATTITAHTGGGLPLTVVDPNGVTTTLTYDARQRLRTSSIATAQGPRTISYTYDPAGNLTRTTLPDGSALTNTYDAAHRLTTITDLFHQNVDYTLDALGDRTSTNLTAVGNRIRRQHSDVFDALGRMLNDIAGMGQTTVYAYDPNGNARTVTDPLGRTTSQVFDALNRLSKSTDPNSGVTTTAYDAHDRLVSVTDPNGNATRYTYDGFGDLIQQVSPDSGTTVYHYDADGNLTSKTDARGIVTDNSFDALDRILTTSYPSDPAEKVAYAYDQAGHGFGIGRLTSLTDAAGSLSRSYDERANLLTDTRVNGVTTLKTIYTYDAASRIASMTYPSGWTASYTRDITGRIWQVPITTPGGVSAGNAITNATYEPFGPLYTLTFGNGINESRVFDLDYRVTSLTDTGTAPLQNLSYAYDANDNVSSIADGVTPGNSQTFGYDVVNRLTSAAGAYGTLGWTYDKLGNRLQQSLGAATTLYGYAAGSNRLSSITSGGVTTPVTYTAAGNITGIPPIAGAPVATISYNAANRLNTVTGTALAITGTTYDAFGQRFSKTSGGSKTLFTYGQDGALREENNGRFAIDYVYLNGRPVAEIQPWSGKVFFLHDDQLGSPRVATDAAQTIVWNSGYQPFGVATIGGVLTQNLRFPGQYSDSETGWDYNLSRDYLPAIGRYVQSDPLGIAVDVNPFLYARGNPLKWTDRLGLQSGTIFGWTICTPFCEGTTITQNGDSYINIGIGTPGASASLQYSPNMKASAEGASLNVNAPFCAASISQGATAVGGTTSLSPGLSFTVGIPVDEVLDNPSVSWGLAQIGLDYRPGSPPEVVTPPISIDQFRATYR